MSYLELRNITFYYTREKPVLRDLNLRVERGELLALLGESGSGKSTLLKIIAGFLRPQRGQVIIDGKDYTNVPPHKRDIGIVFQNYALFPHMTVFENIMYGLRVRGLSRDETIKRVNELLEMLNIKDLASKKPSQLSGGQQQRVAIARALAIRPKILLMDEPMSNIDPKLRSRLRVEIRRIQREFNITTIYVTHDQDDAFEMGDRIAVLHDGVIERADSPLNILKNPETLYVASFLGYENIIPMDSLRNAIGPLKEVLNEKAGYRYVGLRASSLAISRENPRVDNRNQFVFRGKIVQKIFKREKTSYIIETELGKLEVHSADNSYNVSDLVYVVFSEKDLVYLR